ncbi:hypothetical protein PVA48_08675 [Akkermansia sp. JRP_AM1]
MADSSISASMTVMEGMKEDSGCQPPSGSFLTRVRLDSRPWLRA